MSKIIFFGPETPGPGMGVETIQGNFGGPIPPNLANNIFIVGAAPFVINGDPETHVLTLSAPGVASTYNTDNGTANPIDNTLSIFGGTNVSTEAADGNVIIINANTGAQVVNYVVVTNAESPYVALSTDYYIAANVSGGAVTIELPDGPAVGRIFMVKDRYGLAAIKNITVTTVSGIIFIDAATTFIMNNNYASAGFLFNGSGYEAF